MALHLVQPQPARPKLIIEGVSKRFFSKRATVEALENVSLSVSEGDFVCLLGPSGCGKSTLLDIMAGLTKPESGEVLADGQRVTGPGQQRLVMFQEPALGGFKWSSQQLCALISAARQRPRPVFSTRASYAAGRSASRPQRQELPHCACSGQCPWGSTAAEARWCSRSCRAARGCAGRRSRLARQYRAATARAGSAPLLDPRSASVAAAPAGW